MSSLISWFTERDIDLWMAEELRTNAAFSEQLASYAKVRNLTHPAIQTRVGVVDDAGRETDVEAIFETSTNNRFAFLIENKIKAGFQKDQMAGYIDRSLRGIKDGRWQNAAVIVFAPAYRALKLSGLPAGVHSITFQQAAEWIRASDVTLRGQYRASFLERAAAPNIVTTEVENPFIGEWWNAVYAMLDREFNGFFLNNRKALPRTTWVNAKCAEMAKYLRLDIKGSQGQVDLVVANTNKEDLEALVAALGSKYKVVQYDKGAALHIPHLEKYQISDGLEIIDTRVRTSYRAAHELLAFWQKHRAEFDVLPNLTT